MRRYKEVLRDMVNSIITSRVIPNFLQFAYYTMYYVFTYKCNDLRKRTMIRYVFKIPFNSMISAMGQNYPDDTTSLMALSKLFNTMIDGTVSSAYWNVWIRNNCKDLMDYMNDHIHSKSVCELFALMVLTL